MRALVTGGAGFIGSNLVRALRDQGDEVRVLDNMSTGNPANLEGLDDVEVVDGDLRSYERVGSAARGCEVVWHQGALPSVPRSIQDPLTSNAVNVEGTLNVLLAARDAGVRRVVVASSSSLYGDAPGMPRPENLRLAPMAPYAVSKLATEQYALVSSRVFGIEAVALRYFNVFGPRQDPESEYAAVIPRFVSAALRGERAVVYGDGGHTRDFTYVDNVVEANLRALTAPSVRALDKGGGVYNIACGDRVSLLELLDEVKNAVGTDVAPRFEPPRPGDVRDSLAALDLAREFLGYAPSVGLREGIRRTVAWFREAADSRSD